jgi:hypothetical protein
MKDNCTSYTICSGSGCSAASITQALRQFPGHQSARGTKFGQRAQTEHRDASPARQLLTSLLVSATVAQSCLQPKFAPELPRVCPESPQLKGAPSRRKVRIRHKQAQRYLVPRTADQDPTRLLQLKTSLDSGFWTLLWTLASLQPPSTSTKTSKHPNV